jgi:hypothetical protein
MDLGSAGRWMVLLGLGVAGLGALLWLLQRSGLPIGRLPGDLRFTSGNTTCIVPLASSILISLLLTLLLNLILRWFSR